MPLGAESDDQVVTGKSAGARPDGPGDRIDIASLGMHPFNAMLGKPSNKDDVCISRQSQPDPSNQKSQTLS